MIGASTASMFTYAFYWAGGGFAVSNACSKSGLAVWMGTQLSQLNGLNPAVVLLILTTGTAFFTELVSNTATAAILLPVIPDLVSIHINS